MKVFTRHGAGFGLIEILIVAVLLAIGAMLIQKLYLNNRKDADGKPASYSDILKEAKAGIEEAVKKRSAGGIE